MHLFTVLEFFCLLSAFTTCALGFFVHAKNTKSRVNTIFLLGMLGATYWAMGEFFFWQAGSYDGALFWLRASAFWPVVIVLSVHFVLAFTEHPFARADKSPLLLTGLYIPALVISLLGIFTNTLYSVTAMGDAGFVYLPDMTRPVYPAAAVFCIAVILFAFFASYASWKSAGNERKRRQLRLVCAAIATTICFGAISGIILPLFGIYTPNFIFIGFALFSLIITYAITRCGLFTLSPGTALPDILRTMPDGVVIINMEGRIISGNASAARIFRAEEKFLPGRMALEIIPGPAYDTLMTMIREQGTFTDLEAVLEEQGPHEKTVVSMAGSLVREPSGQPAGIVLIIRDISVRKKQEHALQVANEKISLVSQLTRHDINNLVTALSGYLLLLEDTTTKPPEDGYLRTSQELVERISQNLRFSSDFLHLGTFQPDWQSLSLIIARAKNDLSHERVTITVQVPPVEIYADPLAVRVFYNILENALRHGVHVTAITITAKEHESGGLVVLIEDDGEGVPDAEKERIFQYGVGKNTGLGLAFSRNILEVTGITVTETGTFGKGARFEIFIPAPAWKPEG